eukprot:2123119-Amphidinium_carterae.1
MVTNSSNPFFLTASQLQDISRKFFDSCHSAALHEFLSGDYYGDQTAYDNGCCSNPSTANAVQAPRTCKSYDSTMQQ